MKAEDQQWPMCTACGGVINPSPQNSGDRHTCGPLDWARHQGFILTDIRELLQELVDAMVADED